MGAEGWGLGGPRGRGSLAGNQVGSGVCDCVWVLGRAWEQWGQRVCMSSHVKCQGARSCAYLRVDVLFLGV